MNKTKTVVSAVMVALVCGLCACAQTPTQLERTFGESASLMVDQQIYDRSAQERASIVLSLDGVYGENVLEQFRSDIAKPAEVNNSITFNIGK